MIVHTDATHQQLLFQVVILPLASELPEAPRS